jgi:hypothetical protein
MIDLSLYPASLWPEMWRIVSLFVGGLTAFSFMNALKRIWR